MREIGGGRTYKEILELLQVQSRHLSGLILIQGPLDQLPLPILQVQHAILDRIRHENAMDADGAQLTDAVRAVNGLVLDVRVPERIEDDHLAGGDEVEARVAGLERDEHDLAVGVVAEADHGLVALRGAHTAVVPHVLPSFAADGNLQQVKQGGKLAEDDRLLTLAGVLDVLKDLHRFVDLGTADPPLFQVL